MADVKVINTLTGKTGKIPERLFLSSTFNKHGLFEEFDGEIGADCGCNGQTTEPEAEPETLDIYPEDITIYEEEV